MEEFICDVMAGMNDYGVRFENIVNEYWSNQESDIDIYSPAEYTESIDAGGYGDMETTQRMVDEGKLINGQLEDILKKKREAVAMSVAEEDGDVDDEKTRDNRTRTERIPERIGNQRNGDSSNFENLSNGNPKRTVQNTGRNVDGKVQSTSKRGRVGSVERITQTSDNKASSGRGRTDGERFLSALRDGDEETARTLLNGQAIKNGFVPAHMYHGTLSDEVFTQFESEVGIYWVTPSLKYAENYTDGYYGDDIKAEQLFTKPDSGVYDLYIKPGKVLDVGNINVDINIDVIDDFRSRIGFSNEEFNICWGEGRKHEYNYVVVRSVVNKKTWKLEEYEELYAIKKKSIKKGDVGLTAPALHLKSGYGTSPTISISNFLDFVNSQPL